MADVAPPSKELLDSFSILNYLFSGYQGLLKSLLALREFGHPQFNQAEYDELEGRAAEIEAWIGALMQGTPLFEPGWTSPESQEARESFAALNKLRQDLYITSGVTENILRSMDQDTPVGAIQVLIAYCIRLAYSRALFVRGCVDFGNAYGIPEYSDNNIGHLAETEELLGIAYQFFTVLIERGGADYVFLQRLYQYAHDLPFIFRTQVHDISILLSHFDGEFTFDAAGIQKPEAERWKTAGIEASDAGYWRAHLIGPEEAQAWRMGGIDHPVAAHQWRIYGFNPSEAMSWLTQGIMPPLAREWHDAGYTPPQAAAYLQQQIFSPDQLQDASAAGKY